MTKRPRPTHTPALLLVATLSWLAACGPADDGSAEPATKGPTASDAAGRIEVPRSVQANLGLSFASVERRNVARTLRIPGAFELTPRSRREYRMSLAGTVELLVDQYQAVEPGTPLFRFRSPAWPELLHEILEGEQAIDTAEAELAVARAELVETEARIERIGKRLDNLTQANLKDAELEASLGEARSSLPRREAGIRLIETRLENARRTREHALHRASVVVGIDEDELQREVATESGPLPAYRTIDWIEVESAVGGIVETLHVTDGAFVDPPDPVLTTVDPGDVRFRALALQADLPRLGDELEAAIVPPRSPDVPISEGVPAAVTIGLDAHPEERTILLLATPTEEAEWVRSGVSAFLEVRLAGSEGPALAIPRSAVVRDGLEHVFFRRDPSNPSRVIRVEADLGVSDGRWIEVRSGVMAGDEVVLDGAYELKLASQPIADRPGGHVHADGTVHDDH